MASAFVPPPLAAERPPWLRGTLHLPGDELLSHLALHCAAIARGESVIEGAADTVGMHATAHGLLALGALIERHDERWHVNGLGAGGLLEPLERFEFGNSAIGLELMMGLTSTYDFETRFSGDPELSSRPLGDLLNGLRAMGVDVKSDNGRLPLTLHGPRAAVPSDVTLPANAPIAKAALMLAALNVPGTTLFTETTPGSNHAERMLARFGGTTTTMTAEDGRQQIEVAGLQTLAAQYLSVPGDTMLAATGAVACSIVPGSEVEIESVLVNPARTALLSALVAMGASIEARNVRDIGGEEVADLTVRHVGLRGIALAPAHTSRMLDELPLLAIAAACAEGETVLNLPPNLPFLRLARHADLARGLVASGVEAEANDDAIVIRGTPVIAGGGSAPTTGDALLGIAFLVLGMAANEQVTIDDQSGIEERFPGFVERFENIGASFIQDAG